MHNLYSDLSRFWKGGGKREGEKTGQYVVFSWEEGREGRRVGEGERVGKRGRSKEREVKGRGGGKIFFNLIS